MGGEVHEAREPLVPAPASGGPREELVDDRAAGRLEAFEPFRRPPPALVEGAGERVGVLHREPGAGADGEVDAPERVADEHHVLVPPALAGEHRKPPPLGAVRDERAPAEVRGEDRLAVAPGRRVAGLVFAPAPAPGAGPVFAPASGAGPVFAPAPAPAPGPGPAPEAAPLPGRGVAFDDERAHVRRVAVVVGDERAVGVRAEGEGQGVEDLPGSVPRVAVAEELGAGPELGFERGPHPRVDPVRADHEVGVRANLRE